MTSYNYCLLSGKQINKKTEQKEPNPPIWYPSISGSDWGESAHAPAAQKISKE